MSFLGALIADGLTTGSGTDIAKITEYGYSGVSAGTPVPSGFTGGRSFDMTGANTNLPLILPSDQAGNTLHIAFYYQPKASSYYAVLQVCGDAGDASTGRWNSQVGLYYDNPTAKFCVKRGTTVLGYSTNMFSVDQFYAIRMEVKVDNSAGVVKLYVEGNLELNLSGIDTQDQANNHVLAVSIGCASSGGTGYAFCNQGYLYQLIVFNNQGSDNNTMVPWNIRHERMYPDSDGGSLWTQNTGGNVFGAIDEALASPLDDTDYASSGTLNAKNVVGTANPAGSVGTVVGIIINSRLRRTDTSVIGVKVGSKVSTDESQGTELFLTGTYKNYITTLEYKTGTTKFTSSDLNSLELTTQVTSTP